MPTTTGAQLWCRLVVQALKKAMPKYDYTWLIEEVERNLPRELDFCHEAANTARCRRNFASPRCLHPPSPSPLLH